MAAWLGAALLSLAAAAFGQWTHMPGAANDIGVGPTGEAWVIGTDRPYPNDHGIYRLVGSNWQRVDGGAVRIDVGPQGPWVVNSSGGIFRWTGGGWQQMPGAAKDVGIGANGTVWVIGTNPEVGGFGIYRWNPGRNNWDKIPGSAVRIDVDPNGNAWVVTSGNAIFRYDGASFVQMPGAAIDIGIGANGTVFVAGTDSGLYQWTGSTWQRRDGVQNTVSADHRGNPWVVNAGKMIYAWAYQAPAPTPTTAAAAPAMVVNFAPLLRFDSGSANHGYPMSAQDYFARIVLPKSRERLQNLDRNSLGAGTIPTYYHVTQVGNQYRIRYWIYFGYQAPCFSDQGEHNGDWENLIVITTEGGGDIAAVVFGQHGGHYTRIGMSGERDAPCTPGGGRCGGSRGFERQGTHPVVYVGRVAHGLYHDASAGMEMSGPNCAYYLDPRDGGGPSFATWSRLVPLAGPPFAEPWMEADKAANFPWGHDGVNTHPVNMPAAADLRACTGTPLPFVSDAGCYKSECLAGDDQAVERCIKECEPGYTNVGLTCNKGVLPWEWSIYGRLDSGRTYGYAYTLPPRDAGLKRRRDSRSPGEWNLP